mgnify:CR=1 FL=1
MKTIFHVLIAGMLLLLVQATTAQSQPTFPDVETIKKEILRLDSLFWQAYNTCDVPGMAQFLSEDLEFYHDKSGLTAPKKALVAGMKTGLCGNADLHLRREAVKGTVEVFPLHNYGAILSGEHVFYVVPKGKEEYLDGIAKFTHVWRYEGGKWTMARVLSYDHAPPPADFENK